MAIEDKRDAVGDYRTRLESVLRVEADMGERSALLADVADALSHSPDQVEIGADFVMIAGVRLDANHWPSFRDLCVSLQEWRERRELLKRSWRELSAEQQNEP